MDIRIKVKLRFFVSFGKIWMILSIHNKNLYTPKEELEQNMRKKIAKISGILATLGAILIALSDLFGDKGYIPFWIGGVVLILGGIAYLSTGEKIREWFWDLLG